MKTLGQRLKQSRESWAWTQNELGSQSGINAMAISHFEGGRRNPSLRNAVRLCGALGVTLDWLVRGIHPAQGTRKKKATA